MSRLLLLTLLLSLPASAQGIALLPYVGYNTGESDLGALEGGFLVGIGTEFGLPVMPTLDLALRPSVEVQFIDNTAGNADFSYYVVNADVVARFSGTPTLAPFAGAGLAFGIISREDDDADTGFGLNVLGGAEFDIGGPIRPFAQARYTVLSIKREGSDINLAPEGFSILGGIVVRLGA